MFTKKVPIKGNAGNLVLFNAYTLHSTMVNRSRKERVSLRYLFKVHDFSFEDIFEKQ
jgi:ectoine hydroxylase-related dioxygenase (phytanoyl-CoA dioxygenase family)